MLAKIERRIFNGFFLVFMVALFNRELLVFGFDVRILPLFLGVLLLACNAIDYLKGTRVRAPVSYRGNMSLVLFFVLAAVSNIAWLYSGLEINQSAFKIVAASVAFNALMYVVFLCNVKHINWGKSYVFTLLSGIILMTSMVATYLGANLKNLWSTYPGGYIDRLAPSFIDDMRYGGYAQDPNYATIFLIIIASFAVATFYQSRNKLNLLVLPFVAFCILLAASKTILLAIPIALIFVAIRNKKVLSIAVKAFTIGAIVLTVFFAVSHQKTGIQTIDTRVNLWQASFSQFYESPIFGSGLTAARSVAAETKWYVQPHSSIIQVAVDMGLVGLLLLLLVVNRNMLYDSKLLRFLTVIFFAHMLTNETIYQLYFIFFLGILPLIIHMRSTKLKKSATVYVVNTLSNGGAERVVQVMANNSLSSDRVIVYTLYDSDVVSYDMNDKIEIIPLGGKDSKLYSFILAHRLTTQLDLLAQTHKIDLATTHLPFAHLVVRLSGYSNSFIYVMHGMYGVSKSLKSKFFVKMLYRKRQLVAVSKGFMEGDILKEFGVNTKTLKTIYNPQDFSAIQDRLTESVSGVDDAILFVGRFAPPKNPLGVIKAYEKSGITEKYKLIMLGDGPMRKEVEEYIQKSSLGDHVELMGFVKNPYKYMARAKMLVIASDYEAFTMVACEALYCGCPVVSYNIKYGIDEVLTGPLSRYIAKNGDVDDMARVIRRAAEGYPEGIRDRVIKMVDPGKIMQQYYRTYKEWNL